MTGFPLERAEGQPSRGRPAGEISGGICMSRNGRRALLRAAQTLWGPDESTDPDEFGAELGAESDSEWDVWGEAFPHSPWNPVFCDGPPFVLVDSDGWDVTSPTHLRCAASAINTIAAVEQARVFTVSTRPGTPAWLADGRCPLERESHVHPAMGRGGSDLAARTLFGVWQSHAAGVVRIVEACERYGPVRVLVTPSVATVKAVVAWEWQLHEARFVQGTPIKLFRPLLPPSGAIGVVQWGAAVTGERAPSTVAAPPHWAQPPSNEPVGF